MWSQAAIPIAQLQLTFGHLSPKIRNVMLCTLGAMPKSQWRGRGVQSWPSSQKSTRSLPGHLAAKSQQGDSESRESSRKPSKGSNPFKCLIFWHACSLRSGQFPQKFIYIYMYTYINILHDLEAGILWRTCGIPENL